MGLTTRNAVRMEERILEQIDLQRCSLRRGSATNYLVAKVFLRSLVLAVSRYTRSVLDWSERSETVGTTHATLINKAASDIQGGGGQYFVGCTRKRFPSQHCQATREI